MTTEMRIEQLADSTDERGLSFSVLADQLSGAGPAKDIHIAMIRPGHTRGNHYHARRHELIAVIYRDSCSVHWDTGPDTSTRRRTFEGTGAILVAPPLNWSHAVRNDGDEDVWIVAVSDVPYDRSQSDPVARDAIPRIVTS